MKKIFTCLIILIILTGCSKSEFVPPDKVKETTLKGEFVILEDYYYLAGDLQYAYYRGFITEDDEIFVIDAKYKPIAEGYQMHTYTYNKEGIPIANTFYIDNYEIKLKMNEGTLIGIKREKYRLKENDKEIVIIHSGQEAKISGRISNNSEDDLPGLRMFKISSDEDIE